MGELATLPGNADGGKGRGGSRWAVGGGLGGCNPPPPPPPKALETTVNSVQEFKFIVQYARRVQYNLNTKRKQAYPVRNAVEPRGATPSQSIRWDRIRCVYINRQLTLLRMLCSSRPSFVVLQ